MVGRIGEGVSVKQADGSVKVGRIRSVGSDGRSRVKTYGVVYDDGEWEQVVKSRVTVYRSPFSEIFGGR